MADMRFERSDVAADCYPTYEKMTAEQLETTAQMIDEIVAVWDKFYKQTHKEVAVRRLTGETQSALVKEGQHE